MSERKRIGLREVRALGPGEIAWDSGLPGFAARRQRSDAVSYFLKYRTSAGRQQRWHTIGRHGAPWTPETARTEALRVLGDVAKGADPASVKAAAKAAPTVAELAARFLAEHAEAKRKPRTAREYRRLFEKVILPALGQKRVADATRQDIARLHHAKRATPTEANRALALLSVFFTFAERQGERPDGFNPCRHVERFPQHRRERFLSGEELARLGDTLAAYQGSPYHPATIKLLVFTGARLSEVLGLQWDWVSLERGEAGFPIARPALKRSIFLRRLSRCSRDCPVSKATHMCSVRAARLRSSRNPGGRSEKRRRSPMFVSTTYAMPSRVWQRALAWGCRLSERCSATHRRRPRNAMRI